MIELIYPVIEVSTKAFLGIFLGLLLMYLLYRGYFVYVAYRLQRAMHSRFGKQRPFEACVEQEPEIERADVIVVGAGIAGPAIAKALGEQGRKVLVLERDLSEPNRIVGELMMPGGQLALEKLGMLDCINGIDSVYSEGYAIHRKNEDPLILKFPDIDGRKHIARTFHHGRLVMNLRRSASLCENVELRKGTVSELVERDGAIVGVTYKDEQGVPRAVRAPLTIVADGCFSKFRRQLSASEPTVGSYFVGCLIPSECLPVPALGNVCLCEPAPVLVYPISPSQARVLIDIPAPLPSGDELHAYVRFRVLPQLPAACAAAVLESMEQGGLRSMPNFKLHPQALRRPGVLLLGDAFNVRHPLTGGGMTVALKDAVLVRDALAGVRDLGRYGEVEGALLRRWYARRTSQVANTNILAFALYRVFSVPDGCNRAVREQLQAACFEYLRLGGRAADGPMTLLAGLAPNTTPLISHFFSVAAFAAAKMLLPLPSPASVMQAGQVMITATEIIAPLAYEELLARPVYA